MIFRSLPEPSPAARLRSRRTALRHLRRALLASCFGVAVAPTSSFAQNLVLNPGFESNTGCAATSWTAVGACATTYEYLANPASAHSGGESLVMGNPGLGFASISQDVAVAAGRYSFSFWYKTSGAAAGNTFTASVGNNTWAFSAQVPLPYTQVTELVTLGAGTTTVAFTNGTGTFYTLSIDDVSLLYLGSGFISSLLPANAPVNPTRVAAGIDAFSNGGGTLPAGFQNLYNLTPQQLSAALTQASGETATGAQQTTFNAMTLFMGTMTDLFIAGRGDGAPGAGATPFAEDESAANAYASSGRKRSGAERDAYGMISKAAPVAPAFDPRWTVWASGFGGTQSTDGNAAMGSNATTSRLGGVAVGADYWLSPATVAGFALAGGGTSFSVANGGTGHSDLFQAGAFVRHTMGSAYVTGALAYGWQDISTDRTVTIAGVDQLHAQFNANTFSGRLEAGTRFATPWMGVTPYAAAQVTAFDLPAYAEQALSGSAAFALAYGSRTVTDTRTELGVRTDRSFAVQDALLTLRGRVAWAHDYDTDRSIGATFQALPGASFVVNGAAQGADKALTTAAAELKWRNGISLAATFEGEFSNNSTSYAGKGTVRYAW